MIDQLKEAADEMAGSFRSEVMDVRHVSTGAEGLLMARRQVPSLVVVSEGLPDLQPRDLIASLRSDFGHAELPIILQIDRDDATRRIEALQFGVDDCVSRSTERRELILRVNAVLRRLRQSPFTHTSSVGPFRIDSDAHRAYVDQHEVELTPIEFKIFSLLLCRIERVVSREMVLTEIWGIRGAPSTRTVDTHVQRLRSKLGARKHLLETVQGVGYRLLAERRAVAVV